MRKIEAAARALTAAIGYEQKDLDEANYDAYGLDVFEIGGEEWAIGTDEDADKAVKEYIRDSVWAFNADFIARSIASPAAQSGLTEAIKSLQESRSESANDAILEMIEGMGDFDEFVDEAISADGRGHFLSSYDGEEVEVESDGKTYFAYRIN